MYRGTCISASRFCRPLTPSRILANITKPRFLTLVNISCYLPLSRRFNMEAGNGVSPGVDFPGLTIFYDISATSAILDVGNIRLILYLSGV